MSFCGRIMLGGVNVVNIEAGVVYNDGLIECVIFYGGKPGVGVVPGRVRYFLFFHE